LSEISVLFEPLAIQRYQKMRRQRGRDEEELESSLLTGVLWRRGQEGELKWRESRFV